MVPENCDVTAGTEIKHVQEWASQNKMSLNLSKIKDIVFRRPNIRLENIPNDICGVERLECVKLLELYIDSKLSFHQHVDFLIKVCTQFYLLQQMRKQGLTWLITRCF